MVDSLRPESDCILVYKIDALDDLEPRITRNHYVLTESTVPANRLIGAWSLHDVRWLVKPCQADFAAMSNIRSDVDLLLHIAHHQRYWKKREENEETGINLEQTAVPESCHPVLEDAEKRRELLCLLD